MSATSPKKTKLPDGWMGKTSRHWLAAQAKRRPRIVEVGVWKGRSTAVLAKYSPGTVWAVDHWRGTPADQAQHALYAAELQGEDPGEAVYQGFLKALAAPIRAGKVMPVRMASVEAAHYLSKLVADTLDMVFLDGDHSYEAVRDDIAAWSPLLRAGGLLCGHDYAPRWEGVRRAVDEAFGDRVTVGPASIWSIVL